MCRNESAEEESFAGRLGRIRLILNRCRHVAGHLAPDLRLDFRPIPRVF